MFFKQIYDEDLAQGSYLIGCQATGEAVVVDARRDVQVYMDEAARNSLKITTVTETHIHADYLSGSRELAKATGAKLYLSDEGDADWKYEFEALKLYDNSEIKLGNVILKAVHTPGHTPEHLSFLVTDGATATKPGFFLTGDFVFVGDVGRPDLLDEAAGGIDTRFEGAKQLFTSLQAKFLTLPDYVQVWPGHGAGSACGKALGAVASTTVGYERRFSWWADYLVKDDSEGFTKALLEDQPDAPSYFGRMKRHNKAGPAFRPTSTLQSIPANKLTSGSNFILIDSRTRSDYLKANVPHSLHIPEGKRFATYASYVLDPEKDTRTIVLLARDASQAEALRDKLAYSGIDNVVGYVLSLEGLTKEPSPVMTQQAFRNLKTPFILDVRTKSEYEAGHIEGSKQLHAGRVMNHLGELPKDKLIIVHCQTGARATVVTSVLRAAGFDATELGGSYVAYKKAAYAQETVGA
jgi:hydroxyacylglutathione hydrolase